MSHERWTAVDQYISDLLMPSDPVLDEALEQIGAAGMPQISVAAPQGMLISLLAQSCGARSILEVGTLGGYSTIWLARGLQPGGRLISLELSPKHAQVARANIARAGFAEVVEVRVGSALETLPQLVAEGAGPFDLVFLDADKPGYPEYLRWAMQLTRPGSVIIADNVVRDGNVVDASSGDESVQGARAFNQALSATLGLRATIIQMVGSKGYDGMAIAVVQ